MSSQALAWAFEVRGLEPTERVVLVYLANRADEHGTCFRGRTDIAYHTELSERTVTRVKNALVRKGFLTAERRARENGSRTSDLLCLTLSDTLSDRSGQGAKLSGDIRAPRHVTLVSRPETTEETTDTTPSELPPEPETSSTQTLVAHYIDSGGPKTRAGQLGTVVKRLVKAGYPDALIRRGIGELVKRGSSPGVLDLLIAEGSQTTDETLRQWTAQNPDEEWHETVGVRRSSPSPDQRLPEPQANGRAARAVLGPLRETSSP